MQVMMPAHMLRRQQLSHVAQETREPPVVDLFAEVLTKVVHQVHDLGHQQGIVLLHVAELEVQRRKALVHPAVDSVDLLQLRGLVVHLRGRG